MITVAMPTRGALALRPSPRAAIRGVGTGLPPRPPTPPRPTPPHPPTLRSSFAGHAVGASRITALFGSRINVHAIGSGLPPKPRPASSALESTCGLLAGLVPVVITGVVAFLVGTWVSYAINKKDVDSNEAMKLKKENATLRLTIEELSAIAASEPEKLGQSLPHPPIPRTVLTQDEDMSLEFKPGINRKVLLGRIDKMLESKDVNIAWLPDNIERQIYANVMSLMLSVMDDVLKNMSMNFAGHRVNFGLTYLDVEDKRPGAMKSPLGTAENLKRANEPVGGVFAPEK